MILEVPEEDLVEYKVIIEMFGKMNFQQDFVRRYCSDVEALEKVDHRTREQRKCNSLHIKPSPGGHADRHRHENKRNIAWVLNRSTKPDDRERPDERECPRDVTANDPHDERYRHSHDDHRVSKRNRIR